MDYEQQCARLPIAVEENGAILTLAVDEKRQLTDEDLKNIAVLEAEIAELDAATERHKAEKAMRLRQEAREKRMRETGPGRVTPPEQPGVPPETASASQLIFPRYNGRLTAFKGPDAQANAYKSGQFCLAILGHGDAPATQRARQFCATNGIELLAQQEDANTAGGFLVPGEFETAIIALMETYGVFRSEAKVVPMKGDTKTVPRRTGGLTAYFVDENTEITESTKGWDQVKLVVRKIGALAKYSSELDEDSVISMADDLAKEIAYAFASKEDDCGFLGDGTSTYGAISGLITECATATATVVTAPAADLAFSDFELATFESMIGKLPEYAEEGAKWYISKAGWAASMLRLIDAAGGNTGAMIAGSAPKEFLGYPVRISQKMNSTLTDQASTKGLAYLGNLAQASTFGSRRGLTIKSSDQRFIEFDQIVIVGTERFDVKVHDVGDTSVPGSMIMLATPGS